MAALKKRLVIKRSGKVNLWRVRLDNKTLSFAGSSATLNVPPGQHVLQWFVRGAAGQTYAIEVTAPTEAKFKYAAALDGVEKDAGHVWLTINP